MSQLSLEVAYPPVQADAWIVISRLQEAPVRVVSSLAEVDHAIEFALPLTAGSYPTKTTSVVVDSQQFDDLGRPVYDDGSPEGTTDDVDINGDPLPPKLVETTEEREVSLYDSPGLFTVEEVTQAVLEGLLSYFRFYNWGYLYLFDDRVDPTPTYQGLTTASGLAAGGPPFFIGPIQGEFSQVADPAGHLMVVAPELDSFNYYFQIRHGVAGPGGYSGPLEDIEQASRAGEIFTVPPMQNIAITEAMTTDGAAARVSHFWVRAAPAQGGSFLDEIPSVPFLAVLGRSAGATEGSFHDKFGV